MVRKWVKENNVPAHMASCTNEDTVQATKGIFKSFRRLVASCQDEMSGSCGFVRDENCRTIPMDACLSGYIGNLHCYEAAQGTFDSRDAEGRTNMHYAVLGGEPEIVDYLIMTGENCTSVDNNGQTPLDLARQLHKESAKNPRNNIRKTPEFPLPSISSRTDLFGIVQAYAKINAYEQRGGVCEYTAKATTDDYAEVIKILERAMESK
jgi:hypothetical protein